MAIQFTVFKGASSGQIVESQTTLPELLPNQVLLEHTHSGVCGTDAHYAHTDMVLGHEGVGVAKAIGSSVKDINMYSLMAAYLLHMLIIILVATV